MIRLRDVRPYLYYVGWWTAEETWALTGEGWDQSEFEECEPDLVEDGYVRLGREYLLRQQKEKVGWVETQTRRRMADGQVFPSETGLGKIQ